MKDNELIREMVERVMGQYRLPLAVSIGCGCIYCGMPHSACIGYHHPVGLCDCRSLMTEQLHGTVANTDQKRQQAGAEHQTADLDDFRIAGQNVNQQANDSNEQAEVNDHAD